MTRQQIEQKILKVLAEETTAVGISDKLFTSDGLFSLLASTKEERKVMVQTALFKQAQQRFRALQFNEAEEFQDSAGAMKDTESKKYHRVKIERVNVD